VWSHTGTAPYWKIWEVRRLDKRRYFLFYPSKIRVPIGTNWVRKKPCRWLFSYTRWIDDPISRFMNMFHGFNDPLGGFVNMFSGFRDPLSGFVNMFSGFRDPLGGFVNMFSGF
jgi:hypothetical protein